MDSSVLLLLSFRLHSLPKAHVKISEAYLKLADVVLKGTLVGSVILISKNQTVENVP